jgi:hypothetical protein
LDAGIYKPIKSNSYYNGQLIICTVKGLALYMLMCNPLQLFPEGRQQRQATVLNVLSTLWQIFPSKFSTFADGALII